MSSPSRLFHSARISGEGAQPRIPGWIRPAKRTPGILWCVSFHFDGQCRGRFIYCLLEQNMPSKSQMALAALG